MKRWQRRLLSILLGMIALAGIGLMLRQLAGYRSAREQQERARELAQIATSVPQTDPAEPAETPEPDDSGSAEQTAPLEENVMFLFETDLAQLQQTNADVLGWIHIPDTDISFPLMRSYDNEDYLYRAWDGSYSAAGSIFLECRNNRNLLDFNTIIYGHHMGNGTVFGSLMKYKEQEYRDEHEFVYILTENDLRRYRVFSAYEAPVDGDTYRLYYPDNAAKEAAIACFTESSVLEYELTPETDDYILTLSTCTGTGVYTTRWVVQCVLDGIWLK